MAHVPWQSRWSWLSDWLPGDNHSMETRRTLSVHSHHPGHLATLKKGKMGKMGWLYCYIAMKSSIWLKDLRPISAFNIIPYQLTYVFFCLKEKHTIFKKTFFNLINLFIHFFDCAWPLLLCTGFLWLWLTGSRVPA